MIQILPSELLDVLLNSLSFLIVDLETSEILKATKTLEIMFGYNFYGVLQGQSIDVLYTPEEAETHKKLREEYIINPIAGSMTNRPTMGLKRDGTKFSIDVRLFPCTLSSRKCAIVVMNEVVQ